METKAVKRGRPKLPAKERKSVDLHVRLSIEEARAVERKAGKEEISSWVRRIILTAPG